MGSELDAVSGTHFMHTAPPAPCPQGPGSAAKKRRALLRGLAGAWGDIALGGSGSHFVEKAYALAVSAVLLCWSWCGQT